MTKRNLMLAALFFIFSIHLAAQKPSAPLKRPKLVVGLVVDQMRWDFLYRYQQRYTSGGFNRLLREGFTCENTFIPYTPTVTAAGHTCVYTGSIPGIHGIAGNYWYDRNLKRPMYCSESLSDTVFSVGGDARNGKMSPANMLTTTITDELRLATNFKSTVVGVCIKDRGAIFPAGHSANAAFWYDGKTGNWITSTFYMKELPEWLKKMNATKLANQYYAKNWKTLKDIATYKNNSDDDEQPYEGKLTGAKNTSFPHDLLGYAGRDYEAISTTPFGNSMTFDVARAAVENYQLGLHKNITDFLAISLSSTDYVGHRFGPNSIEVEDTYLRLDEDMDAFMKYLDGKLGAGNYTVFLTADHGVAHVPGFLTQHKIPAGNWENGAMLTELKKQLFDKTGESLVLAESNYQLYIDEEAIVRKKLNRSELVQYIIDYCKKQEAVANAFELKNMKQELIPNQIASMIENGYHTNRSGDIQIILKPGWIDGSGKTGTTHGLWNPYDAHIPMLWAGWGIRPGKSYRNMYMTDIAPTLAALLNIQMPNGCIGQVMTEVLK